MWLDLGKTDLGEGRKSDGSTPNATTTALARIYTGLGVRIATAVLRACPYEYVRTTQFHLRRFFSLCLCAPNERGEKIP